MNTSDLHFVLIGNSVEGIFVSHKLGKLNVDRGSHRSSQVSWAGCDVTEVFIMGEFGDLLDLSSCLGESGEDCQNISTLLHRNNSKLILLINPNKESLGIIMEDTSSIRPVSVKTTSIEESISLLEKER